MSFPVASPVVGATWKPITGYNCILSKVIFHFLVQKWELVIHKVSNDTLTEALSKVEELFFVMKLFICNWSMSAANKNLERPQERQVSKADCAGTLSLQSHLRVHGSCEDILVPELISVISELQHMSRKKCLWSSIEDACSISPPLTMKHGLINADWHCCFKNLWDMWQAAPPLPPPSVIHLQYGAPLFSQTPLLRNPDLIP